MTRTRRPEGLRLGEGLTLPLEAITETFAILAKRRVGKSNAAVVMAEEMHDAGLPWVAIDPKGDWHGIRADGDRPGLPVPVLGGDHGDIPLDPGAGAYVADLIAEQRLTCVLDVSGFTKAGQIRFLLAFAERLLRVNRDPLHLFLEECDEYIPQEKFADEAKLVRAFSKLIRHGGFKGIGCTLITQRPALVSKNVLSQVETLILLRTTAPLDQDAVKGWLKHHPDVAQILASLNALRLGEAWVVSPAFLETTAQVTFRRRATFDSGATPKMGEARREPARWADVDLAAIKEAMATTIAVAQADDPKALHRRIAELEHQLADAQARAAAVPPPLEIEVEVPVLTDELRAELRETAGPLADVLGHVVRLLGPGGVDVTAPPAPSTYAVAQGPLPAGVPARPLTPAPSSAPTPTTPATSTSGRDGLTKAERAILTVLVQHPDGRTKVQLALLTGYSAKSSGLRNALGSLRSKGLITKTGEPVQATPDGWAALGPYEPLPTGPDLFAYWLGQLSRAERSVLEALAAVWPNQLDRDALAAATGYSAASSGLRNALGRLRSLELVDGWAAADDFMEATR